jgi:hypothetical protein
VRAWPNAGPLLLLACLRQGYPSIWRGFMGQYARQAQGGKPASKRAQKNIQEQVVSGSVVPMPQSSRGGRLRYG